MTARTSSFSDVAERVPAHWHTYAKQPDVVKAVDEVAGAVDEVERRDLTVKLVYVVLDPFGLDEDETSRFAEWLLERRRAATRRREATASLEEAKQHVRWMRAYVAAYAPR